MDQQLNELEMELIAPQDDHKVESISQDFASLSKLFSLGAENLEPADTRIICNVLGITAVIDVLQKTFKRRVDHQRALESANIKWLSRPGLSTRTPEPGELQWLKSLLKTEKVMLLGGPEAPGKCWRSKTASLMTKHGVECVHVYQDQLIKNSELEKPGDDYDYIEFPQGRCA